MTSTAVVMVLAPVEAAELRNLPLDTPAWIADAPGMQATVASARAVGLVVTTLKVRGDDAEQWFFNHVDTVDQHHNEFNPPPHYSDLLVFGIGLSADVAATLREFGFVTMVDTSYGLKAGKRPQALLA